MRACLSSLTKQISSEEKARRMKGIFIQNAGDCATAKKQHMFLPRIQTTVLKQVSVQSGMDESFVKKNVSWN